MLMHSMEAVSLWETGFICVFIDWLFADSLFLWPVQGLQDKCSYLAAAYSNIDKWALMLSSCILREFGTLWAQQFFTAFVSFCQAGKKIDNKNVEKLDNWLTWKCIAWSNFFLSGKERNLSCPKATFLDFTWSAHIFVLSPYAAFLCAVVNHLGGKLYQI